MKKLTVIAIALIYLFLSIGIRINMHYCGEKFVSVNLVFDAENCCGKEDLMKCCKDKISYLKISDSQNQTTFFSYAAPDFSEALVPAVDFSKFYLFTKQEVPVLVSSYYDSDALPGKNAIYIINRSFRV